MKKHSPIPKTFVLFALLLCSMATMAQQAEVTDKKYRHHIELSVGEPFIGLMWQRAGLYYSDKDRHQQWLSQGPDCYITDGISVSPICVGYFYQVLDWMQVGGEIATTIGGDKKLDVDTHKSIAHYVYTNLYIAGGVRFNYYHKNILDLYSGLTIGATVRMLSTETNSIMDTEGLFTFHLTALGLRFGKQVYGVVEVGYGYKGLLTLGVGTRF